METDFVTSDLLWRCALTAALIDVPLLILIALRVSPGVFRQLKWHLVGAAFVVYALLWGIFGSIYFWTAVYRAIFPAWFRPLLPIVYGLLYGLLALAFWWLSLRVNSGQAAWFCLLGGLVSLVGHSIGISRGLMKVPMLAQASIISALVFGVFEFIFYWCVIVLLAAAVRWIGLRIRQAVR